MNFWEDLIAQRQEAFSNVDSAALRQRLLKKQGKCCFWCQSQMGSGDRSLDHVLPHSLGGPYVLANLVLAHQDCNERRGSRFGDHLLQRLPNSVLALAIENLQTLRADAYEATSEKQARVLELRPEMETKLWFLLVQRLAKKHESFMKDKEPALERHREIERQEQLNRNEKDFQKLAAKLWKSKVGRRIRRFEKEENLAARPIKKLVVVRRPKKL